MNHKTLAIHLLITSLLTSCSTVSSSNSNSPEIQTPTKIVEAPPAVEEKQLEAVLAVNTEDATRGMIYLVDSITGERRQFLELSDLYSDHYHPIEYRAGSLFVIHRFDYEGLGDSDWRSELWVYDQNGNGRKITGAFNLDFRASPDGMTVAVSDNESLTFLDQNGNEFSRLTIGQIAALLPGSQDAMIDLEGWSQDGAKFWGKLTIASQVLGFFETNNMGGGMQVYDLAGIPFSSFEYAINFSTGKLVFSDHPVFFDADSAERFKTSGQPVTLYLLDLPTQTLTVIANGTAMPFDPVWLGEDRIEYNNPANPGGRLEFMVE